VGGPRQIGAVRRHFGGPSARVLGLVDGLLASEDKSQSELHKFKDRAELGGADASAWWAEVSGALNGECAALASRIEDSDETIPRLVKEIAAAEGAFKATGANDDELRFRRLERDLVHSRQERAHLIERLRRAEEDREAAFRRARAAAFTYREHYESVMRSYSAANRRSLHTHSLPEITLPEELAEPRPPKTRGPRLVSTPDTAATGTVADSGIAES
jgi:hypothetical protein